MFGSVVCGSAELGLAVEESSGLVSCVVESRGSHGLVSHCGVRYGWNGAEWQSRKVSDRLGKVVSGSARNVVAVEDRFVTER